MSWVISKHTVKGGNHTLLSLLRSDISRAVSPHLKGENVLLWISSHTPDVLHTTRWKITTRNLLLPVYWMCFMTLEWSHPLSWYKLAYRSGFYVTLQKQLTNERNETLTRAWNVGKGKFTLLQSSKYLSKHHCKNSNCIDLVWTLHSQIKLDKRAGPHYWNHSKELMCINTAGT